MNPYKSPRADQRADQPERLERIYARPQLRFLAAVIGAWMIWVSIDTAVGFSRAGLFWRLSPGVWGGFTGGAYLLWIAISGHLFFRKRNK